MREHGNAYKGSSAMVRVTSVLGMPRALHPAAAVGPPQAASRGDRVPSALASFTAGLAAVTEDWEARVKVLEEVKVRMVVFPAQGALQQCARVSCAGLRNATQG